MIFLGTPSTGKVHALTAMSVARDVGGKLIDKWDIIIGPLVSLNRNCSHENFVMNSESEYFGMADEDVIWGKSVLEELCKHATDKHPVVFADMPDRNGYTTAYNWDKHGEISPAPYEEEPFTCDAFGTGLFVMTRKLALGITRPFELRTKNNFQRREDLSFSLLLQEMSIKPLCLTRLNILHATESLREPRNA